MPEEWREALSQSWPNAPPAEALLGGIIGGLVYIEDEALQVEQCKGDVWARGSVCNVISKVIQLYRPVPCSGAADIWPLPAIVMENIAEQLPDLAMISFDLSYFEWNSKPTFVHVGDL